MKTFLLLATKRDMTNCFISKSFPRKLMTECKTKHPDKTHSLQIFKCQHLECNRAKFTSEVLLIQLSSSKTIIP